MTAPLRLLPDDEPDDLVALPDAADDAAALARATEEHDAAQRQAAEAMYGPAFPLLKDDPTENDWIAFGRALWDSRAAAMAQRLHLCYRNRRIADGDQWISSRALGRWRTPDVSADQARIVWNVIKPALDLRLNIVVDQRPGFKTRPRQTDAQAQRKAEAQQAFLEYQYDEQLMARITRESAYWAQRDGVSFLHPNWDTEAGPWHEFDLPGKDAATGAPEMQTHQLPAGDIRTKVYRIDQVRVAANATATERPWWAVLCDEIPVVAGVGQYGAEAAAATKGTWQPTSAANFSLTQNRTDDENERFLDTDTTERFIVYLERSSVLPNGLFFVVVGDVLVLPPTALPTGRAPLVRITDGSSDPAYFCKAQMEDWLDEQMQINNAASKFVDTIRRGAGGQIVARSGAIQMDTLMAGLTKIIEVNTDGPISDVMQWVTPPSIGGDVIKFIELVMKAFEEKSGWNAASRGSYSAESSGRAILAQREAVERIHTPSVMAVANGLTDWAGHVLDWARWGYDLPRTIAVIGHEDLAREVSAETFDGVSDVQIDPETLMPMPRAMRMFILDDLYTKKAISLPEYRRRYPFGFVQNLETADTDHLARARRVADAILRLAKGEPVQIPPMLWQDNEAIHQDTLERLILLDDDAPPQATQLADQRWKELAGQQQMKMGGPPPAPAGSAIPKGPQMSPRQQPLLGSSPGLASAPARVLAGGGDAQTTGSTFDRMRPQ